MLLVLLIVTSCSLLTALHATNRTLSEERRLNEHSTWSQLKNRLSSVRASNNRLTHSVRTPPAAGSNRFRAPPAGYMRGQHSHHLGDRRTAHPLPRLSSPGAANRALPRHVPISPGQANHFTPVMQPLVKANGSLIAELQNQQRAMRCRSHTQLGGLTQCMRQLTDDPNLHRVHTGRKQACSHLDYCGGNGDCFLGACFCTAGFRWRSVVALW